MIAIIDRKNIDWDWARVESIIYDASIGRFLEVDPDNGEKLEPSTFYSKYIYVQNNPVHLIDPLGLWGMGSIGSSLSNGFSKALGYGSQALDYGGEALIYGADFCNTYKKEIIITGVVIGVTLATGGTATPLLIAGGIGGTANMYFGKGGSPMDRFIKGFAGGVAAAGIVGGFSSGAIWFGGAEAGTSAALGYGVVGGAFGGVVAAHANAQITRGEWATKREMTIGAIAGGITGMFTGMFGGSISNGATKMNDANRSASTSVPYSGDTTGCWGCHY